jgi:helix-turn-helix protein
MAPDNTLPAKNSTRTDSTGQKFKKVYVNLREHLHEITGSELKVWMYFLLRSDKEDESYPSNATVAKDTGLNEQTVKKAKATLRKLGWQSREKQTIKPDGTFSTVVEKSTQPWLEIVSSEPGRGWKNRPTVKPYHGKPTHKVDTSSFEVAVTSFPIQNPEVSAYSGKQSINQGKSASPAGSLPSLAGGGPPPPQKVANSQGDIFGWIDKDLIDRHGKLVDLTSYNNFDYDAFEYETYNLELNDQMEVLVDWMTKNTGIVNSSENDKYALKILPAIRGLDDVYHTMEDAFINRTDRFAKKTNWSDFKVFSRNYMKNLSMSHTYRRNLKPAFAARYDDGVKLIKQMLGIGENCISILDEYDGHSKSFAIEVEEPEE